MNTIGQRETLSRTGTPTGPSAMVLSRPHGENSLASYAYDAQSRLISRSVGVSPTTATAFIYDGWNRIGEFTVTPSDAAATPVVPAAATLSKTYLWGLDMSGSFQGAGGVGGLLSVNTIGGSIHYPTYDGNGNITEYLTAAGDVTAHFEYDPFGNTVVSTDTTNQFEYRFSTKPIDSATGLFYYGYRWYDPLTGRWPSRDPIGERGGVNLYGFVGNDGVNWVDLLGEVAVVSCKRYKWNGRFAQVCWIWEVFPCTETCCKDEAEAVRRASTKTALMDAIKKLGTCLGKSQDAGIFMTGPIFTNMWTNHPGLPNGKKGPVPERVYRVLPKPSGGKIDPKTGKSTDEPGDDGTDFHKGIPSLTDLDESTPGVIRENGVRRTGVRVHGPPNSEGCQTCESGTSKTEGEGLIEQIMNYHANCGGMYWEIEDGGEPHQSLKDIFEGKRPVPPVNHSVPAMP